MSETMRVTFLFSKVEEVNGLLLSFYHSKNISYRHDVSVVGIAVSFSGC